MTPGVLWSWRIVRDVPGRALELEGRAGHLAWSFIAVGERADRYPRWTIECRDVTLAEGRGMPSLALAVALVVEHVTPFLTPAPTGVRV